MAHAPALLQKLSVGQKIVGGFASLMLLIACSNAFNFYKLTHIEKTLARVKGYSAQLSPETQQMVHQVHAGVASDLQTEMIVIPIIFMVGIALAWLVSRNVVRPIREAASAIERISKGNTEFALGHTGRGDELGQMMRSLGSLKEKVSASYRLKSMVDTMPTSVVVLDMTDDGRILYGNAAALAIAGNKDIDGFTVDEYYDASWKDLVVGGRDVSQLPLHAELSYGDQTFKAVLSAIPNQQGESSETAMLAWTPVTEFRRMVREFEGKVGEVIEHLASSAANTRSASELLSQQAAQMVSKSGMVAGASEGTSSNVQSVAAATEEMTGSIAEIGRQVQQSTNVVAAANQQAGQASQTMEQLSQSAREIGEVVDLIVDIAEQTSLLALNATIEAAAAGDAGRGFAVVAHEVKNLASETAKATEIISSKIADVQAVTQNAVTSIENITKVINDLQEIAATISTAIEQQTAATREISASIAQASGATINVCTAIGEISNLSNGNGHTAAEVLDCANTVAGETERLRTEVNSFLSVAKSA